MQFPIYSFIESNALELEQFRQMDYDSISTYQLPIELMMENAGLQLARLIAAQISPKHKILIGVGNGNNGGGGLVAARRLAAWGFQVGLHTFTEITKPLPKLQLDRAKAFGVQELDFVKTPDVWVDAYLGFSQRLPLREDILDILHAANESNALRISLDLPTGFLGDLNSPFFQASQTLTLAAPKKVLLPLIPQSEIYLADLGIPKEMYQTFGVEYPPFHTAQLLKLM